MKYALKYIDTEYNLYVCGDDNRTHTILLSNAKLFNTRFSAYCFSRGIMPHPLYYKVVKITDKQIFKAKLSRV